MWSYDPAMSHRHIPLAALAVLLAACAPSVAIEGGDDHHASTPSGGGEQGSSGDDDSGRETSTTSTGGSVIGTTSSTTGGGSEGTGGSPGSGTSSSTGGSSSDASSSSAGGSTGTGGSATLGPGFNLIGAYANNLGPAFDLIDPVTGQGAPIGHLEQFGWGSNIVLNAAGNRVYFTGNPYGATGNALATIDFTTGVVTQVITSAPQSYELAGVTDDERAIGVYWDGSKEQVDLVDPVTGAATNAGHLGDLYTWGGELVYDRTRQVVYAWGSDHANQPSLYALRIDTHVSSKTSAAGVLGTYAYPMGGIDSLGNLVATTWNGSAEIVNTIDPYTAAQTSKGPLADLHWLTQTGSLVYDPSAGVAYGAGMPASSADYHVYTLDLATGHSSSAPTSHQYILARR